MPIDWMGRLAALLAPESESERADVEFSAGFRFDRQGLVTIDLTVRAGLPLVCQRSLETYVERVDRRSMLAVIENMADQEELPELYEPVLVEERRLALVDLVEEELLLAVPQVPRSPEAGELELPEDVSVEASSEDELEPTHRPFEGLAGLMKDTAGD
jgi:uncharacterized protein